MTKVITDEKLIDAVLTRGVENIFPSREELKKVLISGKRIRLYCGYDPTAKSLHLGNAISINKLGQFQKLGHEVIFLIGDFTGMIGDPTDKSATRKKLTREEVLENSKNYQKQASRYLKFDGENPAIVKYNSEWSDKLTFKGLVEIASNFTLQQMIDRKMFKKELAIVKCVHCGFEWKSPIQFGTIESFESSTLMGNTTNCPNCGKITGLNKEDIVVKEIDQIRETPIGFHELLYPFAQAYDSLIMQVDLEIGGNDQTFNMRCGRDMMKLKNVNELANLSKKWWQKLMFWNRKAIKPKEKFVMTIKLLADEKGTKMGKTEGNVVNLDEIPENMFGQIMAWSDGLINPGFELCTNLPENVLAEIKEKMKDPNNNPRDFKLQLAYEITKINHGEEIAKLTKENFIKAFSKGEVMGNIPEFYAPKSEVIYYDLSGKKIKNIVKIKGLPSAKVEITKLVVKLGMANSVSDSRRKIEQGGVSLDGEKVSDWRTIIDKNSHGKILQVGKFRQVRIKFQVKN